MALTLNGTTGLSGIAGSAGTPALQGNNDANTGYFFAADTLGLSTAGTERLRIDSNGNVSIHSGAYDGGNTVPQLYVRGTSGRQVKIHNPNAGTCSLQLSNSTTGQGEDNGFQLAQLGGGDFYFDHQLQAKDIVFRTKPSGGSVTERLRITSTGQLVIGATTSKAKFEIKDNGYTETAVIQRISTDDASPYALIIANDTCSSTATNGMQFFVNNGGDHYIRCRGSSTAGNNNFLLLSQNDMRFSSGSSETERLRIDSDGRVLIGQISSSSSSKLCVYGAVGSEEAFLELNRTDDPANNQNIGVIEFSQGSAASRLAARIMTRRDGGVWGASSLPTRFEFHTCVSGSNTAAERVRISSNGNLNILDGDLQIGTAGHGIDFSATADGTGSPDELLDDYEEGQFNPGIEGTTSAGTFASSSIEGHYTKIGNMVNVNIYIDQTSTDGTGEIRVVGIPFACKGGSPGPQVAGSCFLSNVDFDNNFVWVVPHIWSGSSKISLWGTKDNATWAALTLTNNTGTGPSYIISITYPAA